MIFGNMLVQQFKDGQCIYATFFWIHPDLHNFVSLFPYIYIYISADHQGTVRLQASRNICSSSCSLTAVSGFCFFRD